jgi:hypothetical protein
MRRIAHRPPVRHGLLDLSLFQWSATLEVPPFTTAGRYLYCHGDEALSADADVMPSIPAFLRREPVA